jgi:nucleotide-binding universal stress UspA family protein
MARIRRVLVASDFSEASRRAFSTAVELAKGADASLTVLHVIEPPVPILSEQYVSSAAWTELDQQTRTGAARRLKALVDHARKRGVRATGRMTEGIAAEQVIKAARSVKADLVVVGTHGRTGLSKFFLGSVAQRVVAGARCPVVTVRSK